MIISAFRAISSCSSSVYADAPITAVPISRHRHSSKAIVFFSFFNINTPFYFLNPDTFFYIYFNPLFIPCQFNSCHHIVTIFYINCFLLSQFPCNFAVLLLYLRFYRQKARKLALSLKNVVLFSDHMFYYPIDQHEQKFYNHYKHLFDWRCLLCPEPFCTATATPFTRLWNA